MRIELDFNSPEAIYIQLRNQIVMQIAQEQLRDGDSLPSVRCLAGELGVNMHTVNKAYAMLRQEGYLKLDRRRGAVISVQDAASCHQKYIGTEHLVLGLLSEPESLSGRVLYENGLTYENFLEAVLGESAALGDNTSQTFLGYSPKAEHVLSASEEEALRLHSKQIGTEHILLALIKERDCIALRLMKGMNINVKKIYIDVLTATGIDMTRAQKEYQSLTAPKKNKRKNSMISSYCVDITHKVKDGRLDPIVGNRANHTDLK